MVVLNDQKVKDNKHVHTKKGKKTVMSDYYVMLFVPVMFSFFFVLLLSRPKKKE